MGRLARTDAALFGRTEGTSRGSTMDRANPDYMPGLSDTDKKERLARISYRDFLLDLAKVHPDVIPFFDDEPKGSFCVGIDGYPALYGWAQGYPGFQGMNLEPFSRVGPLAHIGGGQHGLESEWNHGPNLYFSGTGNANRSPAPGSGRDSRRASGDDACGLDHVAPCVRPDRPRGLQRPDSSQQHGGICAPPGRSRCGPRGRNHLCAGRQGREGTRGSLCDGVLQRGHPAPRSRAVRRAEDGAHVWRQDAPRLHKRPHPSVDGLHESGHLRGECSGDVPHRGEARPVRAVR